MEVNYGYVVDELRRGVRDENRMAQAFVEAEGDEKKAQALYMKYRLQDLQYAMAGAPVVEPSPPPPKIRRKFSFWTMLFYGIALEFISVFLIIALAPEFSKTKDADNLGIALLFVGMLIYLARWAS